VSGVAETSFTALRKIEADGTMVGSVGKIIDLLACRPDGLTRREIEELTGLRPNQVSGRVRELIKQKRVVENRHRACSITGNEAKVVELAPAQEGAA